MIREEMDAMRGADRPGAGIEDRPEPEGEEPIDVLMDVKARLAGMNKEEMMQLAADLDGDMVTALRHILSDKMYDPRDQSSLEEADEMKLEQRLFSDAELRAMPKEEAIAILMGPPGRAKAGGYMSRTAAKKWLGYGDYSAASHGLPPRYRERP